MNAGGEWPGDWTGDLLQHYGLGQGSRVAGAGPGRHILLEIDAPGQPGLIFKGADSPPRDLNALRVGLEFQDHVARKGGPAPGILRGADGAVFHHASGLHGAIHIRLTGRPATATPEDAAELGGALARIHRLGDGWSGAGELPLAKRATLVDGPARRIRKALDQRFEPELDGLIARLGHWIDRLPRDGDVFGPCHGDSHYENASADAAGVLCFYDFEHAVRGWRAFDLASFIWGCFGLESGAETWNAFMQGYGALRPISEAEALWIRPFLVVRQLWWLGFNAGADGPLSDKMRARLDEGLGFLTHLAQQVGADEAMTEAACPA